MQFETRDDTPEPEVLVPDAPVAAARRRPGGVILALMGHRMGRIGVIIVGLTVVVAILAPLISPYDPAYQDAAAQLVPPSSAHWLGTDEFGRDILARVIFGAQTALIIGGVAAICGGAVGVLVGMLAGYYGRATDGIITSGIDVILAFPGVLLALLLVVILGPGIYTVGVALAIGAVPIFARLTRASVLQLREREYVLAARVFGASGLRIMLTHLLRNCTSPILVQASLVVGVSVLTESALSFLGLGIQPPTASWGLMLNQSRMFMSIAPWYALAPGMALTVFLIGLVMLSDGLRDVLDLGEAAGGRQ
jgi:peptide/nickel transport system permease protein